MFTLMSTADITAFAPSCLRSTAKSVWLLGPYCGQLRWRQCETKPKNPLQTSLVCSYEQGVYCRTSSQVLKAPSGLQPCSPALPAVDAFHAVALKGTCSWTQFPTSYSYLRALRRTQQVSATVNSSASISSRAAWTVTHTTIGLLPMSLRPLGPLWRADMPSLDAQILSPTTTIQRWPGPIYAACNDRWQHRLPLSLIASHAILFDGIDCVASTKTTRHKREKFGPCID
eukprot:6214395-Pleurochrysis_carterae.AAC.2